MEDNSKPAKPVDTGDERKSLTDLDAAEDGRNKEWEDRARVNLDQVPEGTRSSVERDFEPERPEGDEKKQDNNEVY
ncbi:MAG TPA: hypothetical protein VEZ17_12615 [Chitinophagaceae bacterium]|jgi:hypothetical protein|nr:hypothetical protein [Chitinophagaceae bacterium]